MSNHRTWAWSTSDYEVPANELPADRLTISYDADRGRLTWKAWRRHRQVDSGWWSDSSPCDAHSLHLVAVLQVIKGYGPLFWYDEQHDVHLKTNLMLVGHSASDRAAGRDPFETLTAIDCL